MFAISRDDDRAPAPPPPATSPPVTTPASTAFPDEKCTPAAVAGDGVLGLAVPRPARLSTAPIEQATFTAAMACLQAITSRTPMLRTQLPIDVMRRTAPPDDEVAELNAFAALLRERGAGGIVSIRAHDFTRCGRGRARERTQLAPAEPLGTCQYPDPGLYAELFGEIHAALRTAAPEAGIRFTAWNEPDHPDFTLHALGERQAARKAGEYWAQAARIAGAGRVLAGEFADRRIDVLLQLRDAFVRGAGQDPPAWALHPYRDLTSDRDTHVVDRFEAAVAPASVWLTEVTARLSGRGGISGRPHIQAERGAALRSRLESKPTRAMLYLLLPPPAPQPANPGADGWDSALADRSGRARPFVCGLAALPVAACPGDPAAYGG